MDNVPVRINHAAAAGRNTVDPSHHAPGNGGKHRSNLRRIIIAVVSVILLAILTVGVLFFYRSSAAANIDGGKYQAVFFTNGQVYFGKLTTLSNGYLKLNNIFYLQAQTTPGADSKNPQATSSDQASDVQLIKLGSEVHGPDDEMIISRDQVLFFENLKKDGKVSASIVKYQSQKK